MMILATFAAAAPAAVVVRNKTQKYYSLARSPLRLPGSADIEYSWWVVLGFLHFIQLCVAWDD
jgi:hypothetical protein